MTKELNKLKNNRAIVSIVLPPATSNKITIVLDLDETLVFASFKKPKYYDFSIKLPMKNYTEPQPVYITKRYGLDLFLYNLSLNFEIVIFSASIREYVELVLP